MTQCPPVYTTGLDRTVSPVGSGPVDRVAPMVPWHCPTCEQKTQSENDVQSIGLRERKVFLNDLMPMNGSFNLLQTLLAGKCY